MNNEIKEMTIKEIEDALGYNIKIIREYNNTKIIRKQNNMRLAEVPQYETFKIGNIEFIVLEHVDNITFCLTKNFIVEHMQFDEHTNNLANASMLKILDDFERKITDIISATNMYDFETDLTTDDGLKDYGLIIRKASLLTDVQYRKHSEGIKPYWVDDWWWLANAVSTPRRDIQHDVRCVTRGGSIYSSACSDHNGIRAVCVFNSCMFVER